LPKVKFKNAFEIACAIGVLTEKLAPKCERLLSVDYSEPGLVEARKRCSHLPQVRFEQMQIPQQFPTEKFDLILFSEVGFFLTMPDLLETKQKIIDALVPGGYLLMVHFGFMATDYFLHDGDTVHNAFLENSASSLKHLGDPRKKFFMVDLLDLLQKKYVLYLKVCSSLGQTLNYWVDWPLLKLAQPARL
jgi:trans-aconitate methyltransferase